MLDDKYINIKYINTWKKILTLNEKLKDKWIFRGQKLSSWNLETTFERYFLLLNGIQYSNTTLSDDQKKIERNNILTNLLKKGYDNKTSYYIEYCLMREFVRKSNKYLSYNISEDNYLETLALMQHYGAPTRLLDFTYSFFISLYFAIENADSNCAIYAINTNIFSEKILKKIYPNDYKYFVNSSLESDKEIKNLFKINKNLEKITDPPEPFVCSITPFYLNERLNIQKGTFLCQSDLSQTFEDNLNNIYTKYNVKDKIRKYIIVYDSKERKKILNELDKMNINNSTLFPGLSGFASSLSIKFIIPGPSF